MKNQISVRFEHGMDEERKRELAEKEWCDDVSVVYGGRLFNFEFISFLRLSQEFDGFKAIDRVYLLGDNTIILDEVSYESIIIAIEKMKSYGYFDDLR